MKKRRLLGIVLSLCMVLALMPQMVFADETTRYDLWQVDGAIYYAEAGTHIDFNTAGDTGLPQGNYSYIYKLPYSGTYVLQTDIAMTESKPQIDITTSGITLDLNGKVMTSYSTATRAISIEAENATIQDSVGGGTIIKGTEGSVAIEGNGSLALNSGTIETIKCFSGILYADGGTVNEAGTAANGTITQHTGTTGTTFTGHVNNGGAQCGNISGGIFYGEVLNGGSGMTCTISNGIFYGKVINGSGGRITGGEFHDKVSNSSDNNVDISGGVFYGEVSNDYNSNISGGVFYGKVINNKENNYIATISGGVFYGGIEDKGGTITNPYHTVSFDLDGGSGTVPVTQYFVNTNTAKALEPVAPTREGYEFAGWYNGDTKYDFTQDVTQNIVLTAQWEGKEAPVITGLENGKTYCDAVEFEVTDNVGVASVEAGDVELSLGTNGKYTLEKGIGTVKVVATDKSGNTTDVTVTVNNGHTWNNGVCSVCNDTCVHKDDSPKDHECDICGKTLSQQSGGTSDNSDKDSKSDAEDSAKTGDDANLALWLALMLISGAGITGVTAYTRRKRTNE